MTASLIIFLCAILGMASMVSIKLYELKRGSEFVLVKWRKAADRLVQEGLLKTKIFIVAQEHRTITFVRNLPARGLHFVAWFNEYLHNRYGKHIDMIKGKGAPSGKGQASFFMSAISEYKKDLGQEDSPIEKL